MHFLVDLALHVKNLTSNSCFSKVHFLKPNLLNLVLTSIFADVTVQNVVLSARLLNKIDIAKLEEKYNGLCYQQPSIVFER